MRTQTPAHTHTHSRGRQSALQESNNARTTPSHMATKGPSGQRFHHRLFARGPQIEFTTLTPDYSELYLRAVVAHQQAVPDAVGWSAVGPARTKSHQHRLASTFLRMLRGHVGILSFNEEVHDTSNWVNEYNKAKRGNCRRSGGKMTAKGAQSGGKARSVGGQSLSKRRNNNQITTQQRQRQRQRQQQQQ